MTARSYLLGLALALVTVLFLVWAIGALGIIGDGGRADRPYAAVLALAVLGSLAARLRPAGMALTLLATALAVVVVAVLALATGQQRNPGASVLEILGLNAMYAALFAASALLFHRAARAR